MIALRDKHNQTRLANRAYYKRHKLNEVELTLQNDLNWVPEFVDNEYREYIVCLTPENHPLEM